jgi:ATP-dependent DNA ligase
MQVHVVKGEAPKVSYFSRRGIEHGVQSSYAIFDAAILAQVQASSAILDGEFIVWNKTK